MLEAVQMSIRLAAVTSPGVVPGTDGSATSERILDAAEECMARRGLQRVTMAEVARAAGLSRGALYLHFADRASLLDAVLTRVAWRFVASSAGPVGRRTTLAAQVGEAAVFIRQHLRGPAHTLRLPAVEETALAALLAARIDRLVAEWIEFWLPLLSAAEGRGELRPGLDHRQAGEWIVRLLLSFAVLPTATFDGDDAEAVRGFVATHLVAGLGPAPPHPNERTGQ